MKGEIATLKDVLTYTRDGEWGAENPDEGLVPMRVIRGTDFEAVRHGSLATVPTRYIRAEVAARKALRSWDVLIETAGGSKNRPTGRTLLVCPRILASSEIPFTCASFARFLRIDGKRAEPAYIYWFLQYLYSTGEMEQHQVQHTGVARFQFTRFSETVEIPLPPLSEQRAIAHILGALDDKIELNRRMNETLEAIARAIFKSWFVDFDPVHAKAEGRDPGLPKHIADLFPDRLEDSELGEIPAGWHVGRVDDEFIVTMGQSPAGSTYNEDGDGLPFYQGRTDFGFRYPSRRVYCTDPKRIAEKHDTLVSVRAPVGDTNMASERCCVGRGVAAVRHKKGARSYTYYSMRSLKDDFDRFEAEGTVFGSIGKKDFNALVRIVPKGEVRKSFEQLAGPIDGRIAANELQSQTLRLIRDTFLPKLISGELRLADAERLAGRLA